MFQKKPPAGIPSNSSVKRPLELVPRPRLFIAKGKRNIRVRQVEPSARCLNEGDAFVVDAKDKIFVWYGKQTNPIEKGVAAKFATDYKNEIRPLANVVYLEGNHSAQAKQDFWKALGGECPVASEVAGGDDAQVSNEIKGSYKLLRVAAKKIDPTKLEALLVNQAGSEVTQEMLRADPLSLVLILDAQTELYLWHRKEAPEAHIIFARDYILGCLASRPEWTLVSEVMEHKEHTLFRSKFSNWSFQLAVRQAEMEKKAKEPAVPPFDVSTMFFQSERVLQQSKKRKADAGWAETHEQVTADKHSSGLDGETKVWVVKCSKLVLLSPTDHPGHFFTAESYVVKYVWVHKEKKRCVFYTWQGRDALGSRKGTSALLAQNMIKAETMNASFYEDPEKHNAIQFREPPHFRRLFQGTMAYLLGTESTTAYKSTSLFHLKPQGAVDTVAVQVELTASALNSRDAFILNGPQAQFVWYGKGIQPSQKPHVLSVASSLRPHGLTFVPLEEGKEPPEFWSCLGGHKEYPTAVYDLGATLKTRLFDCSFASGAFAAEEVTAFCQEDLSPDHAYILDVVAEVYVWIGPVCGDNLANFTMRVAMDYVKHHTDGRTKSLAAVYRVRSDQEPHSFTCHFLGWNGLLKASKRKRSTLQRILKIEDPPARKSLHDKENAEEEAVPIDSGRATKKQRSSDDFRPSPPVPLVTSVAIPPPHLQGQPAFSQAHPRRAPAPVPVAVANSILHTPTRRPQQDQGDEFDSPKLVHLTLTRPKPGSRRKPALRERTVDVKEERALPSLTAEIHKSALGITGKVPAEPMLTRRAESRRVIEEPQQPRVFDLRSRLQQPKDEAVRPEPGRERATGTIQQEHQTETQVPSEVLQVQQAAPVAPGFRLGGVSQLQTEQEIAKLRLQNKELAGQLEASQKKAEESQKVVAQHVQCRPQMQQLKQSHELEKRQLIDLHTRERLALRQEYEGLELQKKRSDAEKREKENSLRRQDEEISQLKAQLTAAKEEIVRLGSKRSRSHETEETEEPRRSDKSSKRQRRQREEKTLILQALEDLEKDIETVGQGLDGFVKSTESVLVRMRRGL